MKFFKNIGPATLIAAAFIGPGTVSICALAGIEHQYALIWVMFISMGMTIFLQELSARLAIVSQKDLTQLIRIEIGSNRFLKILIFTLIFIAIVFGNAAYESGNLSGVNIGLQIMEFNDFTILVSGVKINYAILVVSALAFIILHLKSYRYIEKTLMVLVGLLSLAFIFAAVITTQDFKKVIHGIFSPSFSKDDILMIAALVGTTVVPYNLFLHASLAQQKWKSSADIFSMRIDTYLAVSIGILVSICIIITTANVSEQVDDIQNLGLALQPLFGDFSVYFLGIGYISAGLTSAVTAPLAAAYVLNSLLKLNHPTNSIKFKRLSYFILGVGTLVATLDFNPVEVIKLAQISNAILLPIIVIIMVWLSKKMTAMTVKFSTYQLLGIIVSAISLALSVASIYKML